MSKIVLNLTDSRGTFDLLNSALLFRTLSPALNMRTASNICLENAEKCCLTTNSTQLTNKLRQEVLRAAALCKEDEKVDIASSV